MKIIYSLVILLSLISCKKEKVPVDKQLEIYTQTVIIDSCEYIQYEQYTGGHSGYKYSLTHKGNCKNHK